MIPSIQINVQEASGSLAELCKQVSTQHEVVIIHAQTNNDVALIAADDLSSLLETAYLLRSPDNAQRLLSALQRARSGELAPSSVQALGDDLNFHDHEHDL